MAALGGLGAALAPPPAPSGTPPETGDGPDAPDRKPTDDTDD
jgi:hypothetical protein